MSPCSRDMERVTGGIASSESPFSFAVGEYIEKVHDMEFEEQAQRLFNWQMPYTSWSTPEHVVKEGMLGSPRSQVWPIHAPCVLLGRLARLALSYRSLPIPIVDAMDPSSWQCMNKQLAQPVRRLQCGGFRAACKQVAYGLKDERGLKLFTDPDCHSTPRKLDISTRR